MNRRNRTAELLAAAGLVPAQLAVERERSGRETANRNAWLQAAASLVPQALGAVGAVRDGMDDAELSKALEFSAKNADVIDIDDVRKRIDADPSLAAPTKTGNPVADFFSDPVGIVSGGRAKGRAAAADAMSKSAVNNQNRARAAEENAARLDLTRELAAARNEFSLKKEEGVDRRAGDNVELQRDKIASTEKIAADKAAALAAEREAKAKRAAAGAGARAEARKTKAETAAIDLATKKARLAAIEKKNAEAEKKTPLPAEMAEKRSLKLQGIALVPKLRAMKAKVGTGPIEGPVKDALGVVVENPERRQFLQTNNAVQRVAGRILEGGKLAEGDARVYEKFILDPNSMDDDEYLAVLDSVEDFLIADLEAFDSEMRSAGRQVGPAASAAPTSTKPTRKMSEMTEEELQARVDELKKKGGQ